MENLRAQWADQRKNWREELKVSLIKTRGGRLSRFSVAEMRYRDECVIRYGESVACGARISVLLSPTNWKFNSTRRWQMKEKRWPLPFKTVKVCQKLFGVLHISAELNIRCIGCIGFFIRRWRLLFRRETTILVRHLETASAESRVSGGTRTWG